MAWNSPGNGNNNGKQPPCLETTLRKWFGLGTAKAPSENPRPNSKTFSYALISALCGLGIVGLWAMSGVYSVPQGEQAVILHLGKYEVTQSSGVHWYPRFIDSKYQLDVQTPRQMKITQDLLTSDADLLGVSFTLQYRITDLNTYLLSVANPEQLLNQIAASAAQQVVASHTLSELTSAQAAVAGDLRQKITQAAQSANLGLSLTELTMQPVQVSAEFKQSLADLAKAKAASDLAVETAKTKGTQEIAAAEANAIKMVSEANTYKQQAVLDAQSDVAGFNALLPIYLKSPKLVTARLYYKTMQQVLKNSHLVITDVNNFTYEGANKTTDSQTVPSQASALTPAALPAAMNAVSNNSSTADPAKTAAYQRWQETQ